MNRPLLLLLGLLLMPLSACQQTGLEPTTTIDLQLRSSAFQDQEAIPQQYTCDGADQSPPLAWQEPPDGTQSFVLIVDDPDAPLGTWVHWVVYNLPPDTQQLPAGVTLTAGSEGLNDFDQRLYGGPCPPSGKHRYRFKLYALDTELDLDPVNATPKTVEKAMADHILAVGNLTGTYARSR